MPRCEHLRVDRDDLADMIDELHKLESQAGHGSSARIPSSRSFPMSSCAALPDGSWIVELNSETLPQVLVNNQYRGQRLEIVDARAKTSSYLQDVRMPGATPHGLSKSLDQRANTILKVAREIVRQQDAFLVLGVQQSAAPQPAQCRRCHRDARIDGEPRDLEQVHGDSARHLRDEVLLHRAPSPPPNPAMRRIPPKRFATAFAELIAAEGEAVLSDDRSGREAQAGRHRDRPQNHRQISGIPGDSDLPSSAAASGARSIAEGVDFASRGD